MASCVGRLQGQISALKQVIVNYHSEYWKLKNMLLDVGQEEGLTDEQWKVVERKIVVKKLPPGHPQPTQFAQALKG